MIALRPKGAGHLSNAVIDTAMQRHADGFGLMWRDADGLHTQSWAPGARKAFRKALKALDRSGIEYASHFRYATSGPKDEAMAHPYTYEDPDPAVGTVAIMHNGVIGIAHDRAKESDTAAFVRLVLAKLPSRWWTQGHLVYLVNEAIDWSRLVIMTATETVNLHEDKGDWDKGIWYSSDHRPNSWKSGYRSSSTGYSNGTWKHPDSCICTACAGTTLKALPAQTVVYPTTMPTTGGKSAASAAAALGLVEKPCSVIRTVDAPMQFRHGGHNLTSVVDIDLAAGDADYEDAVICETCETIGTVYVIDGTYWIDMAHLNADDDEDLLKPGRVLSSEAR